VSPVVFHASAETSKQPRKAEEKKEEHKDRDKRVPALGAEVISCT
jgi:hypothetical protein